MNEFQAYKKNSKGTFGLKLIFSFSSVMDSVKKMNELKLNSLLIT